MGGLEIAQIGEREMGGVGQCEIGVGVCEICERLQLGSLKDMVGCSV